MSLTPQNTPQPDETTKLIGIAYIIAQLGWFVISKWPSKKARKKHSTDEMIAISELAKRDVVIDDLRRKLDEREMELQRLEKLEPLAREAETLQTVNKSLSAYNENLEKELEEARAELAALRRLPTRKIEPPGE